jgi:uncharacterized DUF497 family protein
MARNWDDNKNVINQGRHGLSFETAWLVFDDPFAVTVEDYIDENGEMRYQTLGLIEGVVIFIAHVYRVVDGDEQPWLINARKAVNYEENYYWSHQRKS